jgi:hypothetical protein
VVEEMQEELGDDETNDTHHPVHLVARPVTGFGRDESAAQQARAENQGIAPIPHYGAPRQSVAIDDAALLEHRVVKLEKAMAAALDILHRLLKVDPGQRTDIRSEVR